MFKLEEKHLEAAQAIAKQHRIKKSCNECYERGWIGITEQNLLVLCTRCVDLDAAVEDWKTYVSAHEDLKEHFNELFEDKPVDEEAVEINKPTLHEHKKNSPHSATNFVPGQKRMGRAKKI